MKQPPAARADLYDPQAYWNARARHSGGSPMRAVCLDDADENACIDGIQRRLLRAALRQFGGRRGVHGKKVLDYGCGTGRWVTFLRTHGCLYHGVDVAEEMLAIAGQRYGDVELKRVEDNRIPYAAKTFDLVWSIAVLHHNVHAAQGEIVAELVRVLKDDGALVLFEGLGARDGLGSVYYPRPLHEWLTVAAENGLSCSWHRGATYFILRALVYHYAARGRADRAAWRTRLTRIDAAVDPYLVSLIPHRYHTRAVMIFRKG